MNTNDLAHIHARRIELSLRRKDFAAAEIALREAIEAVEMFSSEVTVDCHVERLGLSEKMNHIFDRLEIVTVADLLQTGNTGLIRAGVGWPTRDKIRQALLVHGFEF